MKKDLLLLMFFFAFLACAHGQKRWQKLGVVHDDGVIKVELEFYTPNPNTSCQTGKLFKYKYKLTGRYHDAPQYLNWKLDFIDCNGSLYEKSIALPIGGIRNKDISGGVYQSFFDESFAARSIEEGPHDFNKSRQEIRGNKFVATPESSTPNGITGPNIVKRGQVATLSVDGGQLGVGAKWYWYEGDHCQGREIGTGKSIEVQPSRLTTYSVRAIGKYNQTDCLSKTVDLDDRSFAPDYISGRSKICKGEEEILSVKGGALGLHAEWVWYEGECGTKLLGKGPSLKVKPNKPTSYFVRAEGGINSTACTSIHLQIFDKSLAPKKINITGKTSSLCAGESIILSVSGGKLAAGAHWQWYENGCDGEAIGQGAQITVRPSQSTTYFVRGVGDCHATACASVDIPVFTSSRAPNRIRADKVSFSKGESVQLSIQGGRLGASADWVWTSGSCQSNHPIGAGKSITVNPKSKTTYHVKAVGGCSSTECRSISLTPVKKHNWGPAHSGKDFVHLGAGLGLDFFQLATAANTNVDNLSSSQDTALIHGLGIAGEIHLHPLFTEYFTLGFSGGGRIGMSPYRVFRNLSDDEFSYFYTGLTYGSEVAIGIPAVKLLGQFEKQLLFNDFRRSKENGDQISLDQRLNTERFGIGLRLGKYHPKRSSKQANLWDLTFILSRNSYDKINVFRESTFTSSTWNRGLNVSWWSPNIVRIRGSVSFAEAGENFKISKINLRAAYYQLNILYSLNRFY